MLRVALVLENGVLRQLHLEGHADSPSMGRGLAAKLRRALSRKPKGENLACAAVSSLVRSVARLVASRPEWTVDGNADRPGNLSLDIQDRPEDTTEWLRGVTDTLLLALADIESEYPGSLSVSREEG